ncbi:MAG: sulfotransferase family protein [Geminicoccaceae bacterium]
MTIPDFFVIGAFKSGTTALNYMLTQHDRIFVHRIVKETNFFAPDAHLGFRIEARTEYEDLFRSASAAQRIGEVCPSYLFSKVAAGLIRRDAPDARLVAVLRDPADRAFSDFMMQVRNGRRRIEDLRPQIEREIQRQPLPGDRPILAQGLYAGQLSRFWSLFPRSSIKVMLHSDLKNHALDTVNDLFDFIGLEPLSRIKSDQIYNVSGIPRSTVLQHVINRARRKRMVVKRIVPERLHGPAMRLANRNLRKAQLSPELRSLLVSYYRADILTLQNEIDHDLSAWLRC